ncbi:cytochrome P450 1A1-like [Styela clava]
MYFLPHVLSAFAGSFRLSFAFTAILLLVRYILRRSKKLKLPPGPRGLPIIGNILQLGPNPHLTMTEFAKKYGSVYRLKLGSRMVIVVNGKDAIKQALVKQSGDFISRPEMHSTKYICDGHSVAFASMPVDEHKRYRKLIVDALSDFALKKVRPDENNNKFAARPKSIVEQIIKEEISNLSNRLIKSQKENGSKEEEHGVITSDDEMTGTFNNIAWTTCNIFCSFMFGERYAPGDSQIKFVIDSSNEFSKFQSASSISDMMPWVRKIYPGILKNFIAVSKKFYDFMHDNIKTHMENFDQVYGQENVSHEPKNVLDGLIMKCRKYKNNPLFKDEHIMNTSIDLMGAGFDTVAKALMWIFVYASVFEDAQEKIKHEIDSFIGRNKKNPSFADRHELPYTNAFIHEVLRHSSFVPFTIPHAVTRDNVRLLGYDLPRGTIVFINQWSINHEELTWNSPDHFRPERFLDADGEFRKEIGDQVVLFGMGRRICPGRLLAKIEMFLYTTEIIRNCKLSMHPDHPGLPATEYALTMRPETGKMIVEPR